MRKNMKTELMAPAGEMNAALAAFDSGADAVYAGLERFSARERAGNFTLEEMARLTNYARKIGRKVYIALNTLIKESEISDAAKLCAELTEIKPDAVIVQDIGLARMIREYFPGLRLHASTQMALHNSEGVKVAEKIGFSRVILERQLTLEEVAAIKKVSRLEIEVFVHGALCCSLSGCCLLSSWLGGNSGNRGRCKQPCRRKYKYNNRDSYFLSPADLCMVESIPLLQKAGIDALKIEGRLRKADYVANTVSAYRLVIDAEDSGKKDAIEKAMKILKNASGRVWFSGFNGPDSFRNVIQPEAPGISGRYCGKIISAKPDGFEITPEIKIHLGDRLRIFSRDTVEENSFTVTGISVDGKKSTKAMWRERCFITSDAGAPPGSEVYRIGESYRDLCSRLGPPKKTGPVLNLEISVGTHGFNVSLPDHNDNLSWEKKFGLEVASKHPLAPEDLKKEFATAPDSIFTPGKISVEIGGNFFIRSSDLRKIRQEFWAWASASVNTEDIKTDKDRYFKTFINDYENLKKNHSNLQSEKTYRGFPDAPEIKSYGINEEIGDGGELALPFFCPENKLTELKKKIDAATSKGISKFRVTSLYGIELLEKINGVSITAAFPLPVCNTLAELELRKLGFTKAQAWIELEKNELLMLEKKAQLPIEIFREGRIPVLSTRMKLPSSEGVLKDCAGNEFYIKYDNFNGITQILPVVIMKLEGTEGFSEYYEKVENSGAKSFSDFNLNRTFI